MAPATEREEHDGKVVLFLLSLATGFFTGLLMHAGFHSPMAAAFGWGLLAALLNPLVARITVWLSELMHHGAFPYTYKAWSLRRRVWHGAFWPVTFTFWIIVFAFYVSINHVFRASMKAGGE